jgi:hypothetical protein
MRTPFVGKTAAMLNRAAKTESKNPKILNGDISSVLVNKKRRNIINVADIHLNEILIE